MAFDLSTLNSRTFFYLTFFLNLKTCFKSCRYISVCETVRNENIKGITKANVLKKALIKCKSLSWRKSLLLLLLLNKLNYSQLTKPKLVT